MSAARQESAADERLTIRVRRVPGVPIVAARAWLRGGARLEEIPGQALVTGRMLVEGTRRRDFERIARDAEGRGASCDSFGTYETLGVSIDALASDWRRALGWLAELILEPTFPAARFDWVRRQTAAELDSLLDRPEVRTARAFAAQLYHPHVYGRPLHGSAEDLARLELDGCTTLHRRALDHGLIVAVAGAVDEGAVERELARLFADLAAGPARPLPASASPRGKGDGHHRLDLGGGDQAHLFAGHLTVPRAHPDRPALDLLAVALGSGGDLAGRLTARIREHEGLAYAVDVATAAGAGLDPGRLAVYAGVAPERLEQAEASVRDELRRLVVEGLADDELDDARSYLVGSHPFRRETARQWADRLADAVFYRLPDDEGRWYLDACRGLDRPAVEAAARRWIRPDELRVTLGVP